MGSKSSHLHLTDENITSVASWRTALATFIADGSHTVAGDHSHHNPLLPRVIAGLITEYLYPSLDDMLSHKSWVFVHCLGAIPASLKTTTDFPPPKSAKPDVDGTGRRTETVTLSFSYNRRAYEDSSGDWGVVVPPDMLGFVPVHPSNVVADARANTLAMRADDFKHVFAARVRERLPNADAINKVVTIMEEMVDATRWVGRYVNKDEQEFNAARERGKADESGLELSIAVRSRDDENPRIVPSITPSGRAHDSTFRMEFWLRWTQQPASDPLTGVPFSGSDAPPPNPAPPPPPIHLVFTDHVIER